MSLITHIELSAGGATWLIACSRKNSPSNVRKDIVVNSTDGIMSPGESNDDSIPRSYSNGSVFNPRSTRAGKSISIPITFYSEDIPTLIADWTAFEEFVMTNRLLTLKTFGVSKTYNCFVQGVPVDDTQENTAVVCTLLLTARQAW